MTAREKHEQSANETSVCAHNIVGAAGSLLAITPPCLHVAEQWTRFPSKKGWKASDECDCRDTIPEFAIVGKIDFERCYFGQSDALNIYIRLNQAYERII